MSLPEGTGEDKSSSEYNPWPSYRYTGKLHPYKKEPRREVPEHIKRPDYATHPTGVPVSEQAVRGSARIKVLDDEEIEGMRVACKVEQLLETTLYTDFLCSLRLFYIVQLYQILLVLKILLFLF